MRKIENIAVICWRMFGGGAERATVRWVLRMLAMGKRVLWIHMVDETECIVNSKNFDHVFVPVDGNRASSLRLALVEHKIDFCYCINPDDIVPLNDLNIAKESGCLVAAADHNCYFYPLLTARPQVYAKRIVAFRSIDLVTALSPENVAMFKASGVRQCIEMPNYLTFNRMERERTLTDLVRTEILFVGRLCPVKAAERALEIVAELRNRPGLECLHLTVLGRFDTPQIEKSLYEQRAALGLETAVTFVGEVRDVDSYFRQARVLLMTSVMEGAPMVHDEARSFGVPIVMYELPFVPRTKETDGVIAVPQGDVVAMADAIQHCVEDDAYYTWLSRNAMASLSAVADEAIDNRWRKVFCALESGDGVENWVEKEVSATAMISQTVLWLNQSVAEAVNAKVGRKEIDMSRYMEFKELPRGMRGYLRICWRIFWFVRWCLNPAVRIMRYAVSWVN